MHLNATLLGQMITFAIFVWFTMRYVWPLLNAQLEERKKRIADGLAQAEQGQKILLEAQERSKQELENAKEQCRKLLQDANQEVSRVLEAARNNARLERDQIIASGQESLNLAINKAKNDLRAEIANIVVLGAEKILARNINPEDHKQLLDNLAKSL